jgi:acrylyl-CoA reductase (NADPH)
MDNFSFKAFVVEESENKQFKGRVKEVLTSDLPKGDVLIRVKYSSLNYKDALSSTGNRGVTRQYPHTPGIDAAGVVEKSSVDTFKAQDKVIVTSYDLGMNTSGGFGQYIRVPSDWIVKLPQGLTLKQSMIFGTAGFTAGMSVLKLVENIKPEDGDVLVTGATGGVGSLAAGILSHLGYSVSAVSGKSDTSLLNRLGVEHIISRDKFLEDTKSAMLKARWAGVIDTVGGDILATAIKSMKLDGVVTCCGNVASADLPINVFPFILRGVSLYGIDSQHCPMPLRTKVWAKLAGEWKFDMLENMYDEIFSDQLNDKIQSMLKGKLEGRTLLNLN